MTKVSISKNLTHPQCVLAAQHFQQYWQLVLTQAGSNGDFIIGHGANGRCAHMHAAPWNRNLWIWSNPRGCKVFLSLKAKVHRDYCGAGRVAGGAYRGVGHCSCGGQH